MNMGGGGSSIPFWDTLGAVLLLLWAIAMWAAVGGLAYANRGPARPWLFRVCAVVIGLGVIGQIGHLTEHVAQVAYWIGHPEDKTAWMTPWGTGLARGYGRIDPGRAALGMEILHLIGNFIFLAGLAGIMEITRRTRAAKSRRWGRMGMWMQGIHGLEHVSLTLSVWAGAKAIGLSTWFGQLQPGPGLVTYRVWWHFIANVLGSIIFAVALYNLWCERDGLRAAYRVGQPDGKPAGSRDPLPVGV
jgi:hypothetical protein